MYRMAAGVSLNGYVRSMAGAICPDSTRSRRTIRSSEFSDVMSMPSFWLTSGDSSCARRLRSNPPSHRPSVSPPTKTSLPPGVRARRSCDSRRLPPMSRRVVAVLPIREVVVRVVDDVVGAGAVAGAVDLIARNELGHVLADGLDRSGHTPARVGGLGPAEPEARPDEVGEAGHHMPRAPIHAGRTHVHQDLVVSDRWPG